MTNSKLVTLSTICSAAVIAVFLAPAAFADTSASIQGNGAFSDNSIHVSSENTTRISQDNNANITNSVSANANTGDNSSGFNTGGDTWIDTGDAQSNVRINNDVNHNVLSLDGCGCSSNDTHVSVNGNGAYSDNRVNVDQNKTTDIDQNNDAHINNDVNANSNTGGNNSSGSDEHRNYDGNDKYDNYDHPKYDGEKYDGNNKYDGKKYDNNRMEKPYIIYSPKYIDHKYIPLVKYDHNYNDHPSYKDMGNRNYWIMNTPWSNDWWNLFGGNTGGNTTIRTGDANSNVWIGNSANSNYLRI